MVYRITFRLGSGNAPGLEFLETGEPVWDPVNNRLGIGNGNQAPIWFPTVAALNAQANSSAFFTASETIATNSLVNVWNNAGVFSIRNANGTSPGRTAQGYITVPAPTNSVVPVYFIGIITGQSGLIAGPAYLSTTNGQASSTPLSTAGEEYQIVGTAVSSSSIWFAPQPSSNL